MVRHSVQQFVTTLLLEERDVSDRQPATNAALATLPLRESESAPVLTADGIEKSFRRGVWPFSHHHQLLRGVDLAHPRLSP